MPTGAFKNHLYGAALCLFGKRTPLHNIQAYSAAETVDAVGALSSLLQAPPPELLPTLMRHHVVGASVQLLNNGRPGACYTAGYAKLEPVPAPVQRNTLFRTASITKLAVALLVFRLQTLGMVDVSEDISAFFEYRIENPAFPKVPITLGMLLSHTSSIVDSSAYFSSFSNPPPLQSLLERSDSFANTRPGSSFRYSNFAAGIIACLLEVRTGLSFEALAQKYLFEPLQITASFDVEMLPLALLANIYRVLPNGKVAAFDAAKRRETALSFAEPNPSLHYLPASGNLFISATDFAKLIAPLLADGLHNGLPFLDQRSIIQMKTPCACWPEPTICLRHGMGLLQLHDKRISNRILYGHQGFAYGAVNGVFWTDDGDGFISLNSGAGEQRIGHLSALNRDLLHLFVP